MRYWLNFTRKFVSWRCSLFISSKRFQRSLFCTTSFVCNRPLEYGTVYAEYQVVTRIKRNFFCPSFFNSFSQFFSIWSLFFFSASMLLIKKINFLQILFRSGLFSREPSFVTLMLFKNSLLPLTGGIEHLSYINIVNVQIQFQFLLQ